MAITVRCPCGTRLKARDEQAGRRGTCPNCGTRLEIPDAASADEAGYDRAMTPDGGPTLGPETFHSDSALARGGRFVPTVGLPSAIEPTAVGPATASPGSPLREYLYLILVAALVPLCISMLGAADDVEARFSRTFEAHHERFEGDINDEGLNLSKEDFLARLPENRIEGAHLPHQTIRHWLYATIAALGFFGLLRCFFPGAALTPSRLLLTGLFTGTLGIVFLLAVQWVAEFTQAIWIGGRGVVMILFYLIKFVGFSYRAALDPANGFWLSFLGFTFGVGLCEELCKAIPMIRHHDLGRRANWRAYCLLGLASGIGFGISEGVLYAGTHYNGIQTAGIYVVRFVSCVALHAIWSASVGVALARSELFLGGAESGEDVARFARIFGVPMILHGLYDTFLKREMNAYALAVAGLSFAWLCWQVETARAREAAPGLSDRLALA